MTTFVRTINKASLLAGISALVTFTGSSLAAPLSLPDLPLFLPESVPPLNMLVLGRDHKLYYEAYNDASHLNEDDVLDIGYKGHLTPDAGGITYYGYFDSFKCYTHDGARFNPSRTSTTKACGGSSEWSGDFLNYVTTARIDALRKVLYGGKRSTDNDSLTVLERSHIPMDAHSWGKEYRSTAHDGYDIRQYTPYGQPSGSGTPRHLFANVTPNVNAASWTDDNGPPLLRVGLNETARIWEWVSKESPVSGAGGGGVSIDHDLIVRVRVCATAELLEDNCQHYSNGNYKPIGLLQEFGQNDSMYFGLLSGSYTANKSGGVLRRNIGSIRDEIHAASGIFRTDYAGIIATLNSLRSAAYSRYTDSGGTSADCSLSNASLGSQPMRDGECRMWGNPIAEAMYESLRYFAGMGSPTPAFTATLGSNYTDVETSLNLPRASWEDPYVNRPVCSKPFQTVLSDVNVSYDTDQLPGTLFPLESGSQAITNVLPGLNVADEAAIISANEPDVSGLKFIGESLSNTGNTYDGAPTAKLVTSLADIRGLSPEEPTKQGGYYASSVAYFGAKTDLHAATGDQQVKTFVVALSSPLPRIEIPVAGRTITLVPFAKSVGGGYSIDPTDGSFQPTNQIVDFYVENLTPTSGTFQVNFEDVEAGNDHDMDAIVRYSYQVSGSQVTVTTSSDYAAGGIIQHMGYVVSGATDAQNGIYLEVRDRDTSEDDDVRYFLDTPPGLPPGECRTTTCARLADNSALPLSNVRTFDVGSQPVAGILKDPLWYAAKWGGFDESFKPQASRNDIPDDPAEWDRDSDGVPDNYFLVTNALKLGEQLRRAFQDILRRTTSSSSASVNSGSISSDTRVYQARFNTGEWTGELRSYELDQATGALITPHEWDASEELPDPDAREIITVNSDGVPIAFRWNSLDDTRKAALGGDTLGPDVLSYLRGDDAREGQGATNFRERRAKLGDIVSSAPLFVGRPPFRYRDSLQPTHPYSDFAAAQSTRRGMVYAGANDGMLHGFDAETGEEVFGFIPSPVFNRLSNLASPSYEHQYYVDGPPSMGDVFFNGAWRTVLVGGLNKGGRGIYALDITNPGTALDSAEDNASSIVLWEFTDANDADLGLTYSQPAIVKLQNGRWAAVFGNGYNSANGGAVLFIKEFGTGGAVYKLDTGVGFGQAPTGVTHDNGLSTPALVDIDGDRVVEYAYAGDLYGNLWKFDLSSSTPSNWNVAHQNAGNPAPFYQARDASNNPQPITVRPEVGRGPGGAGMIVLFGTGKYLEPDDKLLPPQQPRRDQTFYGIVDRNSGADTDRVAGRANLVSQTILVETPWDPDGDEGPLEELNIRVTSDHLLGGNSGWYIDLVSPTSGYQGEKQVSNPIVRNGNVIFTTLIPDADPCAFGGGSWIMELDMLSGGRLEVTPFDLNNDGEFSDADHATVTLPDGTEVTVPISGLGSTEGILQSPGVIDGEMGPEGQGRPVQYKYLPGSSGDIQRVTENPGVSGTGRQSWRQVR